MQATDDMAILPPETPERTRTRIKLREFARHAAEKEIAAQLRRTFADREGAIDRSRDVVLSHVEDQLDRGDLDEACRETLVVEALRGFEEAATPFRDRRPAITQRAEPRP